MKRGELWRYEPVINRPDRPTARLIVSADSINRKDALPVVYVMHVVDTDPQSLLAVRIEGHGWAIATQVDRPVRKRLVERIGLASTTEMEHIDNAVRAVFDV